MTPHQPGGPSVSVPRTTAEVSAALRDRVLTLHSKVDDKLVAQVDTARGGVVLVGEASQRLHDLRRGGYDGLLLAEPATAAKDVATPERPFLLGADGPDIGHLFGVTLADRLEGQIAAGASMAITPSGYVDNGDSAALRAIIEGANQVDNSAVLTLVPVSATWLLRDLLPTLTTILSRSTHPVLVGLVSSTDNPLDRKGAVAGYAELASAVPHVFGWRADLSGLGLISHGGLGAAIGVLPSQRRFAAVDRRPFSSNPASRSPHVLLPGLLRYSRADRMQADWFASQPAETCGCGWCGGRAVDRFLGSDAQAAHLHNAAALTGLVDQCLATPPSVRAGWWKNAVDEALTAHVSLSNRLQLPVKAPDYLNRWSQVAS